MNIAAISDLHGDLSYTTPECDVLVIGGDVAPDFRGQGGGFVGGATNQVTWLRDCFAPWLKAQPAKTIIGIAGNHDFAFEKRPDQVAAVGLPWIYLENSGCTVSGIKFWGIPHVPNLSRWAFHAEDYILDDLFAAIPADTDVVISHGPPLGILDYTIPRYGSQHAGSQAAIDMLERVRPQLFFCGHIHEGYGKRAYGDTMCYNTSRMTVDYAPVNSGVEVAI